MAKTTRKLPDRNAPQTMQIDELHEIVEELQEREDGFVKSLEEVALERQRYGDELDQRDSAIKGLKRKLDAVNAEKLAVLVFSPTGHHKVELAGPWVRGDYAVMLQAFKKAVQTQTPDERQHEAVLRMRQQFTDEQTEETRLRDMTQKEREALDKEPEAEPEAEPEVADTSEVITEDVAEEPNTGSGMGNYADIGKANHDGDIEIKPIDTPTTFENKPNNTKQGAKK